MKTIIFNNNFNQLMININKNNNYWKKKDNGCNNNLIFILIKNPHINKINIYNYIKILLIIIIQIYTTKNGKLNTHNYINLLINLKDYQNI